MTGLTTIEGILAQFMAGGRIVSKTLVSSILSR